GTSRAGGPTSLGDTSKDGAHPQLSSDFTAKADPEISTPKIPYLNNMPELSKLLSSHDFASLLPTELKELPSKIIGLSREIKELKQHIKDMEIELPGDLKEIPSKLENFTPTITNLLSYVAELKNIQLKLPAEFLDLPHLASSVQEKLKTLDSLPGATTMGVPSADKAIASPAKGEKDADINLKNELVDLLGIDIVESSSPDITSKEEPITIDIPESPNPFLPAIQVEFTFEEIAFTTNNKVVLLYPSHPNQEYFKGVSDFISKCCLKEAFTRSPNQYKEYLSEFWYTAKVLPYLKIWVSTPTGEVRGEICITTFRNSLRAQYLSHSSMYVTLPFITIVRPWFATICHNGKIGAKGTLKKSYLPLRWSKWYPSRLSKIIWEDLIHKLNKKTKEKIVPYPRPELSKLLSSHDFASLLPTELKELPSKIIGLSREIKELKQHIKDMEIELPGDLKEIPSKLENFTPTITNLLFYVAKLKNIQLKLPAEFLDLPHLASSVQEKLKTLDSLPGLLKTITNTLNKFTTLVENASGATTMGVPSADKAIASPAKGEKDADINLKNELVDLLGIDIVR
nr:hypothetical protein [Tanacetum cinerariifolium]